MCCLYLEEKNL